MERNVRDGTVSEEMLRIAEMIGDLLEDIDLDCDTVD
jgi:hypothetical protein